MNERLATGRFYGDTSAKVLNGVTFSHVRHDVARKLPEHAHEAAHFCLLLAGAYSEWAGDVTIHHEPLTLVFRPPNLTHRDEIRPGGAQFFLIELDDAWCATVAACGSLDSHLRELRAGDAVWLALRLEREVREPNPNSLTVEALLYELCGCAAAMKVSADPHGAEPPWLRAASDVLDRSFRSNHSLGELAEGVGVHPAHLAHAFRRFRSCTVGDYVTRLRVQYACRQMVRGGTKLSAIAADAGFADQSHLTRVFKTVTGTTPAAYRRGSSGAGRTPVLP